MEDKNIDLSKYVPFVDFVLIEVPPTFLNESTFCKFRSIKTWITTNKRFSVSTQKNIEKSIIFVYKNLLLKMKIPSAMSHIFGMDCVDLVSDDDDENIKTNHKSKPAVTEPQHIKEVHIIIDDDDDDEDIQIVSYTKNFKASSPKKISPRVVDDKKAHKDNVTERFQQPSTNAPVNDSALCQKTSDQCQPSNKDFSKNIDDQFDSHSISDNCLTSQDTQVTDTTIICGQKNSIQLEAIKKSVPELNNNGKRIGDEQMKDENTIKIENHTIDSKISSEKSESLFVLPKPNITNTTSISNDSDVTAANSTQKPSAIENEDLNEMDVNQLKSVFKNYFKKFDIDLDFDTLDKIFKETDNNSVNKTNVINYQQYSTAPSTSNTAQYDMSYNMSSINNNQNPMYYNPQFVNTLQTQPLPYQLMPTYNRYMQKMNPNDPRVRKMLLNRPVYLTNKEDVAAILSKPTDPNINLQSGYRNALGSQYMVSVPRTNDGSRNDFQQNSRPEPRTYLEYKMQKAEKERLELEKLAQKKREEENKAKRAENSNDKNMNRVFKNLECTVRGVQDYVGSTMNGKRRSSISARSAIANIFSESTNSLDDCPTTNAGKKRRQSVCETKKSRRKSTTENLSKIEPKRRKTICQNVVEEWDADRFNNEVSQSSAILKNQKESSKQKGIGISKEKVSSKSVFVSNDDSDSSDTNDFEKFQKTKRKQVFAKKQPVICIPRLTHKEIAKHLSNNEETATEVEKHISKKNETNSNNKVQQKSIKEYPINKSATKDNKTSKNKQKLKDISLQDKTSPKSTNNLKNTNSDMTERTTKKCPLCCTNGNYQNLISHFINKHKSESYISRLTLQQLKYLRSNIPIAVPTHKITKSHRVKCIFCDIVVEDDFINLYNHYSTHTGEYGFLCPICKLQKPYEAEIIAHQMRAKQCNNACVSTFYLYREDAQVIYLYSCKLCNFVQINEPNVAKHIRDQHEIQDRPELIDKYILAAMDKTIPVIKRANVITSNVPHHIHIENEPIFNESLNDRNESGVFTIGNIKSESLCDTTVQACNDDDEGITDDIKPDILAFTKSIDINQTDQNNSLIKVGTARRSTINSPRDNYVCYTKQQQYFGLFKCMSDNCIFSTNEDDTFLSHLKEHSNVDAQFNLSCSYCHYDATNFADAQMLIKHVRESHEGSYYQCSICCYRSRDPGNVTIHQSHVHTILDPTLDIVYKCSGVELSSKDKQQRIMNAMVRNVEAVNVNDAHDDMTVLLSMKFACIYCFKNLSNMEDMKIHIALNHPDEFAYTCERTYYPEQLEYIPKLINIATIIPIEKIKSCESVTNSTDEFDLKPQREVMIKINEEQVIMLFAKITAKTGVPPDELYVCPHESCSSQFTHYDLWFNHMRHKHLCLISKCPHCPATNNPRELELDEFKTHFEFHCGHNYLCFHCYETFANKTRLDEHTQKHADGGATRLEKILYNVNYSYFVAVQSDWLTDRLDFLLELINGLNIRLQQLTRMENEKLLTEWEVPRNSSWLENLPSYSIKTTVKRCLDGRCSYRTRSNDELFKHLKEAHKSPDNSFKCLKCNFQTTIDSWDSIIHHLKMHTSNLYLCSSCSFYHYDRRMVSVHCRQMHTYCDVAVVSILRANTSSKISISFAFAKERKTFSKLSSCFCCNLNCLNSSNYLLHLKKDHDLELQHACEYCDKIFVNLLECDAHFQLQHPTEFLKIRCELSSRSQLFLDSLNPFKVCLNEPNVLSPKTNKIKTEIDDDIQMVEADEVAIVDDYNAFKNKPTLSAATIKLVNIQNLL